MTAGKLKMWIGNLDGSRQGLVIAPTKERARKIVGTSRSDFDGYWVLQPAIDASLDPDVLYTRRFADRNTSTPWQRGICPKRPPLDPTRKVSEGGHLEHRLALGIDCPEPRCRAPKGEWCPMPETTWNLCRKRINIARGYDERGNEIKSNHTHRKRKAMSYPPIKNGTRVKATVLRSGKGDYTQDAIEERIQHDGKTGVVYEHHDSHGLCYGVKFEDGVAFFDPTELEILP